MNILNIHDVFLNVLLFCSLSVSEFPLQEMWKDLWVLLGDFPTRVVRSCSSDVCTSVDEMKPADFAGLTPIHLMHI